MAVQRNRFRSSFGRPGASGKSRAMRCQNSSLLRWLATTKTSKTVQGEFNFLGSRKSVFRDFSWILAELDNFRRQNQIPHAILLQIKRFSALSDPSSGSACREAPAWYACGLETTRRRQLFSQIKVLNGRTMGSSQLPDKSTVCQ